jgi:hypothetical protein
VAPVVKLVVMLVVVMVIPAVLEAVAVHITAPAKVAVAVLVCQDKEIMVVMAQHMRAVEAEEVAQLVVMLALTVPAVLVVLDI